MHKFFVKDQLITERYSIYNSDCMYVMPGFPDHSIDLSIHSPSFRGIYKYSSSENDLSNCDTPQQFLEHYEYQVEQIARLTKPGRIAAVHIADIIESSGDMYDLPGEVKKLYRKYGFDHRNTITIWKEPLKVRMRTMVRSLMHKLIVEDSSECFTAMPDYVLIFKKRGENAVPVQHPTGLSEYHGKYPLLIEHFETYGLQQDIKPFWDADKKAFDMSMSIDAYIQNSFNALQKKYAGWEDPKSNKLSHIIWQRYASSVWDDIRIDNVLPFRESKDEDDEKHVHPLQLDVIGRLVELYSNPGEVVLTNAMGVGSEVFGAVELGRKGVGIELKESYYKQAVQNLATAKADKVNAQLSLI